MTQPLPVTSRKRPSPEEAGPDDFNTGEPGLSKRMRTLSPEGCLRPKLRLSIPGANCLPTPPSSAAGAATMALKLLIPQEETTREQQRKLKRHRADAERWKPKLQRPYPTWTETKKAYPLKLMRHFQDESARVQPNFIKPKIDKSPRLSCLLQHFPISDPTQHIRCGLTAGMAIPATPPDLAIPLSALEKDLKEARSAHAALQTNMRITESEPAQRLAWQSFSLPEQGRVDRGREAMVHSSLAAEDLMREACGQPNKLPDWKRPWTGRFALGYQQIG